MVLKRSTDQYHKELLANPSRWITAQTSKFLRQNHTLFIKLRLFFKNNSCTFFVLLENEHLATGNYKTWAAHQEWSSSDPPSQRWCDRNTPSGSGYNTLRAGFRRAVNHEHGSRFQCAHPWCTSASSSHKASHYTGDSTWLASWLPHLEQLLRKVRKRNPPTGQYISRTMSLIKGNRVRFVSVLLRGPIMRLDCQVWSSKETVRRTI